MCEQSCVYRKTIFNKGKTKGASLDIESPFDKIAWLGSTKQTFTNGLCDLLTRNDIGPMECQQPDHTEKDCPDIAEYREE